MKIYLFFIKVYYNTIGLLFPKNSVKRLSNLFATPRGTVVRLKEIEVLNQAKTRQIKSGEYDIQLYIWGSGTEYALLCHGWESNAGSLGAMVEPILAKDISVIAFDGPAHGKSSGKQASLIKFKDVLISILEENGTPKIAIGHSLGAMAIMLAAAEIDLPINKTVLFAPINQVSKVFLEFKEMINIPDKLFKSFILELEKKSGYKLGELVFEEIAIKSSLKRVLVLHDEQDKITSISHSEAITKNWSNSNLAIINGSGHYKILWNDDAIQKVIRFLE